MDFQQFISTSKRYLTAAALLDGLKTSVWVVPLTVLIWVYAEKNQPQDEKDHAVLIDVRSPDRNRIVTLLHRGDDVPIVNLSGPRSKMEEVKTALDKPGDNRLVVINVPTNLPDGDQKISIAPEIEQAAIFSGITVKSVSPATIDVHIDTLKQEEVEVKAPPGVSIDGTPIFEPAKVQVRAPSLAIKGPIVAFVQIPSDSDLNRPGIHENTVLAVTTSLAGEHVTVTPSTVTATYSIKQSDRTLLLKSVPVRRDFAPGLDSQATVDAANVVDITIVGPPDEIDRIDKKAEPVQLYANLRIDYADKDAGDRTRALTFEHLEPHVIVKPDNAITNFPFSVKSRTANP